MDVIKADGKSIYEVLTIMCGVRGSTRAKAVLESGVVTIGDRVLTKLNDRVSAGDIVKYREIEIKIL